MSELTANETVQQTKDPIHDMGSAFMLHPETMTRATEQGYQNPFGFYFAGRGGVLGDVDGDVVAAAFGWFNPDIVRAMWSDGVKVHGAREAARRYAEACAAWGRDHLGGADDLDRLCDLAEKIVDTADVSGLPLFAGWKNEPRAGDAAGRAMQLIHVLREWRGAVHLVGTTAVGLGPLEAVMAKDGEGQARMFGWSEPFPDGSALSAKHTEAEAITDRLCAEVVERALKPAERSAFTEIVLKAQATVGG